VAIFIQAYAEKINSSLKITFKLSSDKGDKGISTWEHNTKSFILGDKGDQTSQFKKVVDDIWLSETKKPTHITQKEFYDDIIIYTLGLKPSGTDANSLTSYYNSKLSMSEEEILNYLNTQTEGTPPNPLAGTGTMQTSEQVEAFLLDQKNAAAERANTIKARSTLTPPLAPTNPNNTSRPTAGGQKPVLNKNISEHDANMFAGQTADNQSRLKGVWNYAGDGTRDPKIEPRPELLANPGDGILEAKYANSALICSTDEIMGRRSHTGAGACYLVAGRSPHEATYEAGTLHSDSVPDEFETITGLARKPLNLIEDAAYIYVSQKSDPDTLLKISGGTYTKLGGSRSGLSLAAIKADDVVIMSRKTGIRLVTGGGEYAPDKKDSQGGETKSTFGVEIIAGNNAAGLQPMVLGTNLKIYLTNLSKSVDRLRAVVYSFITSQLDYNAVIATHQHYDPFAIFLGATSTGNPLGFNGGKNYISPSVMEAGFKSILENAQMQMNTISAITHRIGNDGNGLSPGDGYILSQKNKVN
jgi:hypothetical protein